MKKRFDYSTTDLIKDKIIDKIIILYAVVSIPLLIFSFYGGVVTGWMLGYFIQIFLLATFWVLYYFRKVFSFKSKSIYVAFTLLILATSSIHYIGLLSSGSILFMLFVVFAALFLGYRYGLIAIFVVLVVFIVYAILYTSGILYYRYDVRQFINQKYLWISITAILLLSSYTIIFIISKLENANKTLLKESHKNEADYRLLFDQLNEGIIISDIKGNILLVNEKFRLLSSFSDNELINKNISDFLLPEDRENNPIKFSELAEGKTVHNEHRVIDKYGVIRYFDIKASMLPDGRLQSFLKDITESKKIQKEIENEKAFGKNLIEAMHGVFYVFENYEKLVQWNESLLRISGYTKEELEKIHPNDLFASGNYESVLDGITESEKEGSAYFKADLVTKSGNRIPFYNSAMTYEREGKIYLMGMGYDITSLIHTEKALKISEENFKNIYNNTSDAIFIFNYDFEILSVNETFFSLTGFNKDDITSINIFDFIFDHNALSSVAGDVNKLDEDRVVVAEYFIRNKDGLKFPVEVRSSRINYEGKPAVVTTFNDISARKNLEKQVYTASLKAEEDERGRIAKDLHDGLGPLLSTCKIYLHNIKNSEFDSKEEKSFNKLSELINESLTGVKEISNNLSPHILRNFGLVHALKSFIEKFSAISEMKIVGHFDAAGSYDEIVEITLYRIVTELLNNSLKYSEAKNISISLIELNNKLKLNYIEDGVGFDYEKMIERKSGLGLFNIKSRINSIGGIIIFKSSIGKGVKVNIETNI